ncbi:hypothetical protein CDV31_012988 [Fusarium ambrosium]|uniref:Amino acid transporter transmembrane domain-containing protein n=1 Tax=Fusarium ambrosium TaxID=131363 RepID=A0A428T6C0_9HYPO|nr:hypothetical protein CDV31_012988 [Fusarium ambrosium]
MKAAITFSLKIYPVPADRLVSQSLYGNAVIQTPPGDTWLTVADITTWSDYIVGVFKLRHPEIYGINDVGAMLFGRVDHYTFVAGSMMLGISIGLNAVSMHGTSTAVFVAVAAIVGGSFASIRTLGKMSWLALVGVTSLIIAIGNPSFADAVSAISAFVFAYAGTPAFFSFAAEMREPKHYARALTLCQIIVTIAYVGIGCVVYYFCGSYVASPAPGSAGPLIKNISYGIAIPRIVATAMLTIHLPGKYLFVRFLQGTKHLTVNTFVHWGTWLGYVFGVTLTAYIIASAIPVFGGLASFIGVLLGTLRSF